jgi:serine/threonine protein kinase
MSLAAGSHLGPFEILSPLGAGGMGVVYKARDTRLGREVAIKVLPESLSGRADVRERFVREARAISSLSHPHICPLYDVGSQDGIDYLVMEYLEGETLAHRLKKGALPLDQTLRYAVEIASALDAAHRKGITHRDLKPGNVMLTKSGTKLLDFGLARMHARGQTAGGSAVATQTEPMTAEGTIVGTLQYMAPEQLEGKDADARTDIFAFGATLYEMATGRKAFEGQSSASLIAAIMHNEPPPVAQFQPAAPAGLDHVVHRCLGKDPERRWQAAADVKLELEWIAEAAPSRTSTNKWRAGYGWAAASVLALLAIGFSWAYSFRKPPESGIVRFSFAPPFKTSFIQLAVSPDGRRVAIVKASADSALWLRSLDSFDAHALPGTEGAHYPFWSPDGRSIAFFSDGKLKRIDLGAAQSSVQIICSSTTNRTGTWSPEGVIIFQPANTGGLNRVAATGGTPAPLTKLNLKRREISHRYPQFLPDGRHFLYWVWSASEEYTGIYIGSLDAKIDVDGGGPLLRTYRAAAYAAGYLLFLRGSTLMAQRFDPDRLRLIGEPRGLAERVGTGLSRTAQAILSLSPNGVLAYQEAAPLPGSRLLWLDRSGKQLRATQAPRGSSNPSLSPDQKHLLLNGMSELDIEDMWVIDLERGAASRLTTSPTSDQGPIWSPDGRRIVFQSNRAGSQDLYMKDASGLGEEELIAKSEYRKEPADWSQDGRFIFYNEITLKTGYDLWVLRLGDGKAFPLLQTEFNEGDCALSPDADPRGHQWLAYASDETGRDEVYLRPFNPEGPDVKGAKLRLSTEGGVYPRWRKDGRELSYLSPEGKLMAVEVKLSMSPEIGAPHRLFDVPPGFSGYASFADGQRFLITALTGEPEPAKINVVLNWQAELKQ